jgi:hypothetical protein
MKGIEVNDDLSGIGTDLNTGSDPTPTYIEGYMVTYTGDIPSGWSDNC